MRKLLNFGEKITIFIIDDKKDLIDYSIKSKNINGVIINHYTVDENKLKKVFNGEYEVLIREELDSKYNTLLVEVFITNDYYNKGDYLTICSLLSRRILQVAS